MPTVADFGAFKITMYFGDHNPPHFHVVSADFAAKVRIDDLTILAGSLPPNVLRRVRDWAEGNRETLEKSWQEFSEGA